MTAAGASVQPLTLLTFAPMVDSETTRLLLHHYGVDYVEKDHLFLWVSLLAKLHGGGAAIPLLYGGGLAINGPGPIAAHFDALLPPERRLSPPDGPLAAQVKADWGTYNGGPPPGTGGFSFFFPPPGEKKRGP